MIRQASAAGAVLLAATGPLWFSQRARAFPQITPALVPAPSETAEPSLRLDVASADVRTDGYLGASVLSIALPTSDPAVSAGTIAEIATQLQDGKGVIEIRLLPCTDAECPTPERPLRD
ncbi:hypothetical protein ACBY01_12470 [Sphingomonas sp. ac-8]|uniref:hypothetical protein n=1 Tax=Sphingomonas sp. ac-8 TaxID=3242977 RepID=UPI003A7FB4C0